MQTQTATTAPGKRRSPSSNRPARFLPLVRDVPEQARADWPRRMEEMRSAANRLGPERRELEKRDLPDSYLIGVHLEFAQAFGLHRKEGFAASRSSPCDVPHQAIDELSVSPDRPGHPRGLAGRVGHAQGDQGHSRAGKAAAAREAGPVRAGAGAPRLRAHPRRKTGGRDGAVAGTGHGHRGGLGDAGGDGTEHQGGGNELARRSTRTKRREGKPRGKRRSGRPRTRPRWWRGCGSNWTW